MNEAEKIKKKLEKYTATTPIEPPARESEGTEAEATGDIWSPNWKPDPNWTLPPRYVELAPGHAKGFRVGDWYRDSRGDIAGPPRRQALPLPNYSGKVGDLITPEMETAYWAKWNIWLSASMAIERCIRLHRQIADYPDHSMSRPDKEETKEMFAQEWQWLKGLWAATPGMIEPTTAQLDVWAEELVARYAAQRKIQAA